MSDGRRGGKGTVRRVMNLVAPPIPATGAVAQPDRRCGFDYYDQWSCRSLHGFRFLHFYASQPSI